MPVVERKRKTGNNFFSMKKEERQEKKEGRKEERKKERKEEEEISENLIINHSVFVRHALGRDECVHLLYRVKLELCV